VKYRYRVLVLLVLLAVIMYLDRVLIAVAGPRMQQELGISPGSWGWVVGIFAVAYAVFEIPSGAWADRRGPRRVLTRIAIWWSAFTALTGLVSQYWLLLAIRFSFGAGEAGAYPNIAASISRWFPRVERARALGTVLMASQIGGALTPLLVVPIQATYGWRASFYLFGSFGVIWVAVWYWYYRDTPSEMPGVPQWEIDEIGSAPPHLHRPLPWAVVLRSTNLWCLMLMAFGYYYAGYFFLSWFQTYLVKGRGFSEQQLVLSTLPFVLGACGNLAGGFASDALVRRHGVKRGRRTMGMTGAGLSALAMTAAMLTSSQLLALVFLAISYLGVTIIQPTAFAVCLDIAPRHGGAVAGAMNTAAQVGAFLSSIAYGYLVTVTGSYDLSLLPMVFMLAFSALLWLKIDPTEALIVADALEPQLASPAMRSDNVAVTESVASRP
jgi:ACS family glucarate transporter-like MFS transporter